MTPAAAAGIAYGSVSGRWVIAATVLGSGMAFLDGTVVNVALPAIAADLGAGLSGLQWTVDAYLVTLAALLLLGGSLGDLYGRRRVYLTGLIGFTAASAMCGLAPNTGALIAARALQGVGAALLVPGSLAILSATFRSEDRSRAIGAWSGLAGVSTAVGPFVGGWLIDALSWRLVFLLNVPVAAVAVAVTVRHVPESRDDAGVSRPDLPGAAAVSLGLGAVAYALIEGAAGFGLPELAAAIVGGIALVVFGALERRRPYPMLPLGMFRSRQFSGANATTFAVYAALGGATFLLVLHLQVGLGYSALAAGASLLPVTVLMLALSSRTAQMAQRIGPRGPMTVGPLVVAAGLVLLARVGEAVSYVAAVLPAVVVFGLGLALTVAPLTAAVLAGVDNAHVGVASGVNNAVARVAGLVSVAVLPALAGIELGGGGGDFTDGFRRAMYVCACLCVVGAMVAFATIRTATRTDEIVQPSVDQPCHHPDVTARPSA